MRRKKNSALSPAEWKIMKILWKRKSGATRDIHEDAERLYGWSRSTVTTLMRRLIAKGYVRASEIGNSFLYFPNQTAAKTYMQAADELLENALEGVAGSLAAHIVQKGDLSPEEIEQLQALLAEQAAKEKEPT